MSLKFQKRVESKMRKRWRVFDATDFQSLMYPCFTLCRYLGIFQYKINNSIFETSKSYYILSIIITCALCVFEFIMIYQINIFTKGTNFKVVIRSFELSCYKIVIVSVAIATLVSSTSRMRLLQTIMEIASKLSPGSYQKLSRLIHAKDIFGFFYLINELFIYCYIHNSKISEIIFLTYTDLLLFTMDMLYINCVCILKTCFEEINNNLLHIQKFIVNNESRTSTLHYKHKNDQFLIINLKAVKKQHLTISNTVQMLNIIFSLNLLAAILIIFIQIIFGLYIRILQWYNRLDINLNESIFTVSILLYTIYQITKMMLFIWACETGKNQAQEIRTTIHDVLNSSKVEQIKHELQLFSLQILHCKNTFSVKVFNVDATCLATMVGTITTYMLIVLQFLIMSQSCDGKSTINITRVI